MKTSTSTRLILSIAVLLLGFIGFGCTYDQSANTAGTKKRIPLAPIGVSSPGIGAPGAGSVDTRATGTVATGEGDTPLGEPGPGSVPLSGAGTTPGSVSVPGARAGGRL